MKFAPMCEALHDASGRCAASFATRVFSRFGVAFAAQQVNRSRSTVFVSERAQRRDQNV